MTAIVLQVHHLVEVAREDVVFDKAGNRGELLDERASGSSDPGAE